MQLSYERHEEHDCHLRLEDKPSTNVDTTNLLRTPTELDISF